MNKRVPWPVRRVAKRNETAVTGHTTDKTSGVLSSLVKSKKLMIKTTSYPALLLVFQKIQKLTSALSLLANLLICQQEFNCCNKFFLKFDLFIKYIILKKGVFTSPSKYEDDLCDRFIMYMHHITS